jgi:YD repeat-containing protein
MYPDNSESSVSVSGPTVSASPLYQYSYRPDGLLQDQQVNYHGSWTMAYTYTAAGRLLQRFDVSSTSASNVYQYDTQGRLAALALPAGTYTGFSYDNYGNTTGYTDYDGETVAFSYDIREELTGESFSPNVVAGDGYETWPAFGLTSMAGPLVQDPSEQWDARTGAILALGSSTYGYNADGQMTTAPNGQSFTYDAEGRLLSGSEDAAYVTQNCGGTGERTLQSYERYGVGPSTTLGSYVYGADGQVAQVQGTVSGTSMTETRHWDGGTAMYEDVNSSLADVQVGYDAVLSGSASDTTGLNVVDRDPAANLAQWHNGTGYSSWTAPNPYHQGCVSASPIAASSGYAAASENVVSYLAPGVLSDQFNQFTGGNGAYMPSSLTSMSGGSGARSYLSSNNNPMGRSLLSDVRSGRRHPAVGVYKPCILGYGPDGVTPIYAPAGATCVANDPGPSGAGTDPAQQPGTVPGGNVIGNCGPGHVALCVIGLCIRPSPIRGYRISSKLLYA